MNYAFFLGAGASKTCHAPLQGEMLKEYFAERRTNRRNNRFVDSDVDTFLFQFFGLDVDKQPASFPTFEEILGVLDLAIMRKEAFPNFENGHQNLGDSDRLSACRDRFVGLMAIILRDKLRNTINNHEDLISRLKRKNSLTRCSFFSTNYDILIDNALLRKNCIMDYGFQCQTEHHNAVKLYKLHGSLNWLYCPSCKEISVTHLEKAAAEYYDPKEPHTLICLNCESIRRPVIVPPTYFKDFSNFLLSMVWHNAEKTLKDVDKIFFCGYSFPDADIQIKYLLKRAEIIRRNRPLKIVIANNHDNKSNEEKESEKSRYERFFRHGSVEYTEESFQSLMDNIEQYL